MKRTCNVRLVPVNHVPQEDLGGTLFAKAIIHELVRGSVSSITEEFKQEEGCALKTGQMAGDAIR